MRYLAIWAMTITFNDYYVGVISGVQTSANGSIDWSSTLPAQCRLSAGLRFHVTPLLAGLLECDVIRICCYQSLICLSLGYSCLPRKEADALLVGLIECDAITISSIKH